MLIPRQSALFAQQLARWFPVLAVTGPRQSGKTTLVRQLFPQLPYRSLEDPDIRAYAEEDPRSFLGSGGMIVDEVQRVPGLLSYIQTIVDTLPNSSFILTGSQNFALIERISQSLAGRVGLLTLLPLSIAELQAGGHTTTSFEQAALQGGYPRIFEREIPPNIFHANYMGTYIERDVRMLKNIGDLSAFQRFVRLCAGRIGQLLNLSSLATDTGISVNTAKSWLSVLEAGYIIQLLRPYHNNFNKRLTKSPKLYFLDTGVACWLLGIEHATQLQHHHARGALFENLVMTELWKTGFNTGRRIETYFWRDHHGLEVDCLIEDAGRLRAVEMKSTATITTDLLRGLQRWRQLAGEEVTDATVIYAGNQMEQRSGIRVIPYLDAGQLVKTEVEP